MSQNRKLPGLQGQTHFTSEDAGSERLTDSLAVPQVGRAFTFSFLGAGFQFTLFEPIGP